MKTCVLALCVASFAVAQSTTTTTTTDFNGNTVQAPAILTNGGRTEVTQSINGRQVPLEKTEEKVLRDDANGKVTERIVKRYDQTGNLAGTERVVTTEQKTAGGGSTVQETTYRSDINGQMQEAERKTTETSKQGNTTQAQTVIERPTINGSFQTAEKHTSVSETSNGNTHQEETVYQRTENGDLVQRLRQVTDEEKQGNKVISKTASFEPSGTTGSLELAHQTVSTTTTAPDGSEVTEVNLYARSADGRVRQPGEPLQVKEQQIISREKGPGGSIIETLSVRRPTVSEPDRLGSLQQISQTVCKGKCEPDQAAPAETPASPTVSK